MNKKLYIITYVYSGEVGLDWLWSTETNETTIVKQYADINAYNYQGLSSVTCTKVPTAIHSQDIQDTIQRYLIKPLKRK